MKIEQYGYVVQNNGKDAPDPTGLYQNFADYPLKDGLPVLAAGNTYLKYSIMCHGLNYIRIAENSVNLHISTYMWSQKTNFQFHNVFVAPFFIEKGNKIYHASSINQYLFATLFNRINMINPYYDKGYSSHPFRELHAYVTKHFGVLADTTRTEKEAGR